jgi:membrane protease YdiL (CAAX protease family)
MRPARAILAYIIFIFGGAALAAPWIFFALEKAGWSDIPFQRVVDRMLLALALAGLWPFVKSLGIHSRTELGLCGDVRIGANLGRGFSIGFVLLLVGATASFLAGASVWDHSRTAVAWGKHLGNAAGTAVVVAFLEEILFRGCVFGVLRRAWNEPVALWASSAIYSIFHFLGRPENPGSIGWSSGFVVLGSMLRGFTDFHRVFPGFFSITLLGVILALAFKRTGALYLSMGIHAGVVFGVKLSGFATNSAEGANRWFWGSEKLVDGWFCFALMAVATFLFARMAKV